MSSNNLQNVNEILRKIPLYNKFGDHYPHETLKKIEVPQYRIEHLQSVRDMFDPWYKECQDVATLCENHDNATKKFDDWYYQKYISSKPPGMVKGTGEMLVLSPSKKG